jgi:cell division septation protein DedD
VRLSAAQRSPRPARSRHQGRFAGARSSLRLGLAGMLGVGAALLVACGAASSPLIPASNAGPLQSDFDAVQSSVQSGDCTDTKSEVQKTQDDLAALPGTVSPQLLETLTTGVQTLAARAATECKQNAAATTTTTGQTSTPTQTQTTTNTNTNTTPTDTNTQPTDTNTQPTDTNTDTQPTDTNTSPTTVPATTVPDTGGGTPAPGLQTPPPSDPSGGTPGGGN